MAKHQYQAFDPPKEYEGIGVLPEWVGKVTVFGYDPKKLAYFVKFRGHHCWWDDVFLKANFVEVNK